MINCSNDHLLTWKVHFHRNETNKKIKVLCNKYKHWKPWSFNTRDFALFYKVYIKKSIYIMCVFGEYINKNLIK